MRVTTLIKVLIAVFGFLAFANVFFSVLAIRAKNEMSAAYEEQHKFTTAIYNFDTLSALFTRYARTHVARAFA